MKKFIYCLVIMIVFVCLFGCGVTDSVEEVDKQEISVSEIKVPKRTYMSCTYSLENDKEITVKIDTSDGHVLTPGVPFGIFKDGDIVSVGEFVEDNLERFKRKIAKHDTLKLLEEGVVDGNEYISWSCDDDLKVISYNIAVSIEDTGYALILENVTSEECAKEIFEKLSFN